MDLYFERHHRPHTINFLVEKNKLWSNFSMAEKLEAVQRHIVEGYDFDLICDFDFKTELQNLFLKRIDDSTFTNRLQRFALKSLDGYFDQICDELQGGQNPDFPRRNDIAYDMVARDHQYAPYWKQAA